MYDVRKDSEQKNKSRRNEMQKGKPEREKAYNHTGRKTRE